MAIVVLSACALVAGNPAGSGGAPLGPTVLPRPSGQLPVGSTSLHLVDAGRPDLFVPERPRELMVTVFYPATDVDKHPRAHYLSKELVPGLEQRLGAPLPGLFTNSHTGAPALAGSAYPVVLYAPGAGSWRVLGTGVAEELASRGYVVVTVDYTYEVPVEFPEGRIVPAAPTPAFDKELRQKYMAARLADTPFVLDALTQLAGGGNPDAKRRNLPRGLAGALNLDRIGFVGHSSGGYTAVESIYNDRRIDAAIDLDGQLGVDELFGRAATEGVDRPVLVLTSKQATDVGDARPSLDAFWQHATGWKRELLLRDSAHYDFTDFPQLVPAVAREAAKTYIGPVPADRASIVVRGYVAAMFDKFLRDRTGTLLDQPPTETEISEVR
ncbi:alpha/beta hydrolase family protein [Nocardia altamirensis]|uniref:alpha/beta hydrolase family protein n=1 Tax=Nocardia altamirensis TaxID=472158 RepID=UPI000AE2D3BD|nr:hypothetical protein [Nocardia altamirensis]